MNYSKDLLYLEYLLYHSEHTYSSTRKEGNVLFNDALNTF